MVLGLILMATSCKNNSDHRAIVLQNDYHKALAVAGKNQMKILVFFNRWGASNCR